MDPLVPGPLHPYSELFGGIIMTALLLLIPTVFLIVSAVLAVRSVRRGANRSRAFALQLLSFLAVCVFSFAMPAGSAFAAGEPSDTAAPAAAAQEEEDAGSVNGLGLVAAALAVGIAGIGGGIAVASAAPAAIGATSEDPKAFGKAMIFVALGEGIALYGLLIAILIWMKC